MRLLNVQTFQLQEFYSDIPKYVVASHRWLRGTEAMITDIKERVNRDTLGYKKVQGFATYIKRWIPGIDWLWIDTCCINQDSSQEVTEAINSMFKWYRNAAVCLAYMVDVDVSDDTDRFAESEWFCRGWTLQELLAPRLVVFLTKNWDIIGCKGDARDKQLPVTGGVGVSLDVIIAAVTGIPESVLDDFQHSRSLTVKERLQWMSRRKTTRVEDLSYCLLGIFDVSLIANYGEGREKARKRLLTEISNDSGEVEVALETLQQKAILGSFPIASRATYNSFAERGSARCLEGTRAQLLRRILTWAENSDQECIFWLCGKAGTGKSTIARTIAQTLDKKEVLAASFFFKRGEGDRGNSTRFFPTIAFQIANLYPELSISIIEVLKKDPFIIERNLEEQFEQLIEHPLTAAINFWAKPSRLHIIIDALDECEGNVDVRVILDLLARLNNIQAFRCRVCVSSRPELPIKLGFLQMSPEVHYDLTLEEAQAETIDHDIDTYLRHRFRQIRGEYSSVQIFDTLPTDWPGEEKIHALAKLAAPLFIFAVTACRYISSADPAERLNTVLQQRYDTPVLKLEGMYSQVLGQLLGRGKQRDEHVITAFQNIIGSVVILAEPLSAESLSRLVNTPTRELSELLSHLHSVLDIPSNSHAPLKLLHASFRDYLVHDRGENPHQFSIDERQTHRKLADRCLTLLARPGVMKQDMCDVQNPGTRRSTTGRNIVERALKADIAYACCYWVYHLHKGNAVIYDDSQVYSFLETSFLYWMEALSWLGKLSQLVGHLDTLRCLIDTQSGSRVSMFVRDAKRFVLRYWQAVDITPLQLYSSAMLFTPQQSLVRQRFQKHVPKWIQLPPRVPSMWSEEVQKLEGHEDWIRAVAFSPDDGLIISASHDRTIIVWNSTTGQQVQRLRGHRDQVNAAIFSPDSRLLASISADMTVKIWDTTTWEPLRELTGHEDWINAIAISRDGRTLASASGDMTIRLWELPSGREIAKLEGHTSWVNAVTFSRCDQLLASGSRDNTIRLWSLASKEELKRLEGHSDSLNALDFSHDGKMLASGSYDTTVRLWDFNIGNEIRKLQGHSHWVRGVSFSYDDEMLASCSHDGTILIWCSASGDQLRLLRDHSDSVNCVTFSHSSLTLASASGDKTVRLWDLTEKKESQKLEGHRSPVSAVNLSHNKRLIASISIDLSVRLTGRATNDNTVIVWSVASGEQLQRLVGHTDIVTVLAFSHHDQLIISGARDKTAIVWNVATGSLKCRLEGHSGWINHVTFSHDDCLVATASGDKTIKLWSATSGEQIRTLEGHSDSVNIVAFSSNDQLLVSASGDKTVRLWKTSSLTDTDVQRFEGNLDTISAVALSFDDTFIASASVDGIVRVWNSADGQVRLFEAHRSTVTALAFSQDKPLLLSASDDGTLILWDLTTARKLQSLMSGVPVRALSFLNETSCIQTDRGLIALVSSPSSFPSLDLRSPRTIMIVKDWIVQGGTNLLWLPHEYRGSSYAVTGNTFIIGQSSGQVTVLRMETPRAIGQSLVEPQNPSVLE